MKGDTEESLSDWWRQPKDWPNKREINTEGVTKCTKVKNSPAENTCSRNDFFEKKHFGTPSKQLQISS